MKLQLVPFIRPVRALGLLGPLPVWQPGDLAPAPPSDAGALKLTSASLADAKTPSGAPGTIAVVTGSDAGDAGPVPAELVAVTVNVWAIPFDSPSPTIGVTFDAVHASGDSRPRRPAISAVRPSSDGAGL